MKTFPTPENWSKNIWRMLVRNLSNDDEFGFYTVMLDEASRSNPERERASFSTLVDFDIMYCAGGEL